MPNFIVANTTSIKAAGLNSSMGLSAAQELLSSLGFIDQRAGIIRESHAYHNKYIRLLTAIEKYEKNPDPKTRMNLLKDLKKEIKSLKEECERIKEKQTGYQQSAIQANQQNAGWSGWLVNSIKQFFGSDNEYQARRYGEMAEARKRQIEKLEAYRNKIEIKNKDKKNESQSIKQDFVKPITDSISPMSRKLLSVPQNSGQFPAVVESSDIGGNIGTVINSVSTSASITPVSIGDVNDDGIDDVFVGTATNQGEPTTSIGAVVFGGSSSIATELSSLDGNNGFTLVDTTSGYAYGGISVSCVGDINKDGINDLAIGQSSTVAYVIFGRTSWPATVNIGTLNGANGFLASVIGSEAVVAGAGDVNKDGKDDLLIGARQVNSNVGETYLLFGKTTWPASVTLSTITTPVGVIFRGSSAENSGASVAGIGDVNNDNFPDILIGAWDHVVVGRPAAGASYVVFGKSSWTSPINLSSLNGNNGFIINGASAYDYNGYTVAKVGDVNHDGINDLLTVSRGANNGAGISNVVFGKASWPAAVDLASLGSAGFKINGITASEQSGIDVSVAGDVNDDGLTDFLIGANNAHQGSGVVYVMFGRSTWPNTVNLIDLDGKNGFVINGTTKNFLGFQVSNEGDINHDGISDIAFAIGTNLQKRKCYIVWGDSAPQLTANFLSIGNGQRMTLNSTYLSATDSNHLAASLRFNVSNSTHIQFELVNYLGVPITSFNQSQVLNRQVQIVHDGSNLIPTYAVSVFSPGLAFLPATPAMINFISEPIVPSSTGVSSSSSSTAESVPSVSSSSSTADASSSSTGKDGSSSSTADAEGAHSSSSTGGSDEVSSSSSSSGLGVATNSSSSTGGVTGGSTGGGSSTADSSSSAHGIAASSSTGGAAGSSGAAASSSGAASNSAVNGGNSSSTAGASGSADSTADSTGSDNTTSPVTSGSDDPISQFFKVENPAMWGAIGGAAGTLLLLWITLRCYFARDLQNFIREEKENAGTPFKKNLLCPIAKKVFENVKVTGCLGYISKENFNHYFTAVQSVVTKIRGSAHYDYKQDRDGMGEEKYIAQIVELITDEVRPARCSGAWWGGFFSHEVTPEDITQSADKIIKRLEGIKATVKFPQDKSEVPLSQLANSATAKAAAERKYEASAVADSKSAAVFHGVVINP